LSIPQLPNIIAMKTLFLLLMGIIACVYTGCTDGQANLNVTRKIFDAFNAHDWPGMLSHYADTATFEDPEFAVPVRGRAAMEKHHRELHAMVPNIRDSIRTITAVHNKVVIEFISTGTTSNGEHFALPICTVLTFNNGKVIHDATYYSNCQQ